MSKAFLMLSATRMDVGDVTAVAGALQQEVRLFDGDNCLCVMLITFPPGSPEWEQWSASRTLDGMPALRVDSIQPDAPPAAPTV